MGIKSRKVNWILDLDIRAFFDEISHEWMIKFLGHRIADKRLLRLIRKGLKAGVIEDGRRVVNDRGCPQGSVLSPMLANLPAYVLTWGTSLAQGGNEGQRIIAADDTVLAYDDEGAARRGARTTGQVWAGSQSVEYALYRFRLICLRASATTEAWQAGDV
jgi:hypothetical protein